jgi:hypothetical protein
VVAVQARALLAIAVATPLIARLFGAGYWVPSLPAVGTDEGGTNADIQTWDKVLIGFSLSASNVALLAVDAVAVLSGALALYRLVPLSLYNLRDGGRNATGDEPADTSEAALSPHQKKLMGGSFYIQGSSRGDVDVDRGGGRGGTSENAGSVASGNSGRAGRPPVHSPSGFLRQRSRFEDAGSNGGRGTPAALEAAAGMRRHAKGGGAGSGASNGGESPMFVGIGPLAPRHVHWSGENQGSGGATGYGERRLSFNYSAAPSASPVAGASPGAGPRVASDLDVEEHIASLGAAIDASFSNDATSDPSFPGNRAYGGGSYSGDPRAASAGWFSCGYYLTP